MALLGRRIKYEHMTETSVRISTLTGFFRVPVALHRIETVIKDIKSVHSVRQKIVQGAPGIIR